MSSHTETKIIVIYNLTLIFLYRNVKKGLKPEAVVGSAADVVQIHLKMTKLLNTMCINVQLFFKNKLKLIMIHFREDILTNST